MPGLGASSPAAEAARDGARRRRRRAPRARALRCAGLAGPGTRPRHAACSMGTAQRTRPVGPVPGGGGSGRCMRLPAASLLYFVFLDEEAVTFGRARSTAAAGALRVQGRLLAGTARAVRGCCTTPTRKQQPNHHQHQSLLPGGVPAPAPVPRMGAGGEGRLGAGRGMWGARGAPVRGALRRPSPGRAPKGQQLPVLQQLTAFGRVEVGGWDSV